MNELDQFIPQIAFFYGIIFTSAFWFVDLVDKKQDEKQKIPPVIFNLIQKRRLWAVICLIVGGLWSFQNYLS